MLNVSGNLQALNKVVVYELCRSKYFISNVHTIHEFTKYSAKWIYKNQIVLIETLNYPNNFNNGTVDFVEKFIVKALTYQRLAEKRVGVNRTQSARATL